MGARAHGRRHEGRRIRRNRRQFHEIMAAFAVAGRAAEFAAMHIGELMSEFAKAVRGTEEQNRLWRERHVGTVSLPEVESPYPTQSGVKDVREALSASERGKRD